MSDDVTPIAGEQEKPPIYATCPCGETPAELFVRLPKGSKQGIVAGNCCGDWLLEFKAGYPKDDADLLERGKMAWNNQPRGTAG